MPCIWSRVVAVLLVLLAGRAGAQAPTPSRLYLVSPAVGDTISPQEKATYGLFPYYAADNFEQAHFEQGPPPDSAVTLHTRLRDGRTVVRPFTRVELAAVRTTINSRVRELGAIPATGGAADSVGRRYRVTLRQGTVFDGQLTARRPTQLEFNTPDLGVVQVDRINIVRLEDLTPELAGRPTSWYDIGNGNRLFFQPTARNLRRGEGTLQTVNLFALGVNYGLTNNFSVGGLVSLLPGVPLTDQLLALTPKVSARLTDSWHLGGGALYVRAAGVGTGILYGNTTLGSADNNFTFGLGYAFVDNEIESTPVVQLGGQVRVSRRLSLVSENYLVADDNGFLGGLYGAKINWPRASLGLGAFYVAPFDAGDGYGYDEPSVYSSYIIPVYVDFTYRFGKVER